MNTTQIRYELALGLPFCQKKEGKEAALSIVLRISALVLGTIAVIGSIFILTGMSGWNVAYGWPVIGLGIALNIAGIAIKCMKTERRQNDEETVNGPDLLPRGCVGFSQHGYEERLREMGIQWEGELNTTSLKSARLPSGWITVSSLDKNNVEDVMIRDENNVPVARISSSMDHSWTSGFIFTPEEGQQILQREAGSLET